MSATLLGKEIKDSWKMLLIFVLILAMYVSVIVAMFDPALGESLNMMAESMPELFSAFGMANVGSTLLEFVANYLFGFLLLVMPLVFIIILANKLVAKYVDNGSMACLIASPLSRGKIIGTQIFVLVFELFLLIAFSAGLMIGLSEGMFPGELDIIGLLMVCAGLFCLLFLFAGVNFMCSCIFNDARTAAGIGAGICVVWVLLKMVGDVSDKFSFLQMATPTTLFEIEGLMTPTLESIIFAGILFVSGIICFVVGSIVFCRKDLNV